MRIAIKNPAPLGPKLTQWGDYHFGVSLQRALERRGAVVRQDFWPDWDRLEEEELILVLRGRRPYAPPPDRRAVLWVMSHPATVSVEEINAYSLCYVASETFHAALAGTTATPVEVMRQCTDRTIFAPPDAPQDASARRRVVFVANSRGVRRPVVQWMLEGGLRPAIIGTYWGPVGYGHLVVQDWVDNAELPALYRGARLSLNDHWADMAHFGIVNNRIFDCLACGLPVLTDAFPELLDICGDAVLPVSGPADCAAALTDYTLRYPRLLERTLRRWERLAPGYGFDARADQILAQAGAAPPTRRAARPARRALAFRSSDPAAARLAKAVRAAAAGKGAAGRKVVLFFPGRNAAALLAAEDFSCTTAGFGIGPWAIPVTPGLDEVADRWIDIAVIEEAAALGALDAAARAGFLRALARKLAEGSGVLLLGEAPDLPGEAELAACGLRPAEEPAGPLRTFRAPA